MSIVYQQCQLHYTGTVTAILSHPLTVTYSGIGRFTACRRMWYLSEVEALRPIKEELTGPLPFGQRMHSALEAWGNNAVEDPYDIWDALMSTAYVAAQNLGHNTEKLEKEHELGAVMLKGFLPWIESSGFFSVFETLDVEAALKDHLMVQVPVLVGDAANGYEVHQAKVKVLIRGKADQIIRRTIDDSHWILDWKTTASFADNTLIALAKSPQMRIYARLAKMANPDVKFYGGYLGLLRKVKQTPRAIPPFYALHEVPMNKTDMIAYQQRLYAVVTDMAQALVRLKSGQHPDSIAYFTPSRVTCTSCVFRHPCDLMADYPAGAVDMLANEFVKHNPFERYMGHPVKIDEDSD